MAASKKKETNASASAAETRICRICHCGDGDNESLVLSIEEVPQTAVDGQKAPATEDDNFSLISPCSCTGSLRYVHHVCLQQWIRSSNHKSCELCKHHFQMSVSHRPLLEWERLEMSNGEKKKLLCNLIFNMISLFCVFWSIYVLIERATFEARSGLLDWPFWTKMLVVSIGFLGGTVFLFVQLRLYLSIFLRWRQYNRIIVIHTCPTENEKNSEKTTS